MLATDEKTGRDVRSLITLTTSVLLALGIAAGAGTVANVREAKSAGPALPTPVVVDTDMSTDDVLALLYLLQRPGLDVRAVTVSGTGLAHCPAGARNALELLALTGHGDVPVACGRPTPLSGFNQFPAPWRAAADAFFGLELPPALRDVDHRSAVDARWSGRQSAR
jgi:Inosine-uridine preferring nucleoside hydrolase